MKQKRFYRAAKFQKKIHINLKQHSTTIICRKREKGKYEFFVTLRGFFIDHKVVEEQHVYV